MTALLRTDDGALWVPVAGAGLGYLRSDWRDVAQFSRSGGVLEGDFYRALAPANGGGVWLGAYNGVIEHIDAAGEIAAFGDEVRERLRDTRMFSLAQDAHGSLWVGAPGRLLRVSFDGAIDEWNRRRGDAHVPSGHTHILRTAPHGSLRLYRPGRGLPHRHVATGPVRPTPPPGGA